MEYLRRDIRSEFTDVSVSYLAVGLAFVDLRLFAFQVA